jgi:hypothetical protein
MEDAPLHPSSEYYGPRHHLVSESFNLLPFLYQRGVAYVLKWVVFAFRGLSWRVTCLPGLLGWPCTFSRELARLKAKELPHLPLQLLALKLYRHYRLGRIYKNVYISAISANLKDFFKNMPG